MSSHSYILIGSRRPHAFITGGWSQQVCVGDRLYTVSVTAGKRVRIAYKPRGPGAYGYQWIGRVSSIDDGKRFYWDAVVGGTTGVKGLLTYAGILGQPPLKL